ncbi:MAG: uroporphyrinogen-III C-methyltransferase, partial [Candidatus Eremiobacteraeota bacterium]|nr:uroporphyrinogen-III C-methyltransferase [Candidatus Eremiobacteraeota bacterium]
MSPAAPPGKVWLVGAGPGDPGLLTLKGARAIANCDTLVYDYLASSAIVALAPPDCDKIYVGKKAGAHTLSQDEITALIVRLGREGKKVVRLKGGDVFVFARGGEEAAELRAAGVPFEIVPGITSAIAAPAYAGIPITHRDHNTSFTIATGHEDPTKGYSSLDYAKLANPQQTLVFLMAMGSLAGIVAKLREHGMPGDLPVGIVREGTKPTQETLVATLDTIVAEVERTRFAAPAIVVIGNVVRERETIRWFDTGPLFGKRVLVTRARDGADEFAATLWEIGAEPVIAPAISIGPPDDPAPARDAIRALDTYS